MSVGKEGFEYENSVIESLKQAGLNGYITEGAGSSSTGADADIIINGKQYLIEVKKDLDAQMGGTSVKYKDGKFDITSSAVDENTTELIIEALKPKQEDIKSFLNFLNQDGFPVNCSKAQWTEAKECGLLKPLNVKIRKDVSFIADIYKSKNIYYIQIGSAGLFYLSENPAKLAIPKLEGEIDIELRAGRSGSKNGMVGGSLRAQGRLKFKGKSPYTLDDPESIKKLIKETKEISWPDEELRDARNQLSHATFLSDQKRVLVHNLVQHPHPKTHLLINISKGEESERY